MDSNKKTFNYTILFFIVYAILAVGVLFWIWWPKDSKNSNLSYKYEKVDGKKKALDIYTIKIKSLLSGNDLPLLYSKLDEEYKRKYSINENNYKSFLEQSNYISKSIEILNSTVNIQEDDVYVYRFTYKSNNMKKYVNVIETKPYEYTLSFEQDSIPIVSESNESSNTDLTISNTKTSVIDNIKYEVRIQTIRENGINYEIQITNNSDKNVEYNFDNVTNVSVVLSNGKEAYLGGAVISADDGILTPNSNLKKNLFFNVSSSDQNNIKYIKIRNVKIGDEKKTVNVSI